MLGFKEALKTLEKSKEFSAWKKKNPEAYLSYGFFSVEDKESDWKIGYYHKKRERMTSFNVGEKITIEPEDDILKKEAADDVEKLELDEINLDLAEAVTIANETQKEEFATENPMKIIAILQKIEQGQVWNVTFLTQTFNTLNFKIKSDSGKIVEKKLQPLFQFDK